jgi:hypothetical protein
MTIKIEIERDKVTARDNTGVLWSLNLDLETHEKQQEVAQAVRTALVQRRMSDWQRDLRSGQSEDKSG